MHLLSRILKSGITPLRGVGKILGQALHTRTPVSLYLGDPPEPIPAAEALISDSQDTTLTLDITRGDVTASWQGCLANCALLLVDAPGLTPRLLHFSATIVDVATPGRVVLSRPRTLNAVEQRSMRRISLPERFMPRIKAWMPGPDVAEAALLPPQNVEPILQLASGAESALRLRDISAGGLRLNVHASLLQRSGTHVALDTRLLLLLALPEPQWETPLEYCFPARVTRNQPLPLGWRDLGLHFLLFSGGVKQPGALNWKPLVEDDIPGLANWVNRRMDELHGRTS